MLHLAFTSRSGQNAASPFFGTAPIWRFRVLCKGYQFATSVAQPMDAHGAFVLRGGFQFFQVLLVGCRSPCKTSLRFGHAGNPAAWSRKKPSPGRLPTTAAMLRCQQGRWFSSWPAGRAARRLEQLAVSRRNEVRSSQVILARATIAYSAAARTC